MRLQGRSEPGTKTLMDEKQSKNDEFSNHLLLHKIHTADPTQTPDWLSVNWMTEVWCFDAWESLPLDEYSPQFQI